LLIAFFLLFLCLLVFFALIVYDRSILKEQEFKVFTGVGTATAAVVAYLLRYLNSSTPRSKRLASESHSELRARLDHFGSELSALKLSNTAGSVGIALDDLRTSIVTELMGDIQKRLSVEAVKSMRLDDVKRFFERDRRRLTDQLYSINRRGNLNLTIGVATTFLAAGLLAYLALKAPELGTLPAILSHYIPRLSTVVFMEVFAFFFLRLYRSSLIDARYYQDELTNLNALEIAIDTSFISGDSQTISRTIDHIASVNKNSAAATLSSVREGLDYKDLTDLLERFAKLALKGKNEKE